MERFNNELDYLFNEKHLLHVLYEYYFGINISIVRTSFGCGVLYKLEGSKEEYNQNCQKLQYLTNSEKLFGFVDKHLEEINLDYFEPATNFDDGIYLGSNINTYEIKNGKVKQIRLHFTNKSNIFVFTSYSTVYSIDDLIAEDEKYFKFKPVWSKLIKILI